MTVPPEAICWTDGRTLANVAVYSPEVLAALPGARGEHVPLPCDLLPAGKMRNGAAQWWCRMHQKHWGTTADIAGMLASGSKHCAHHLQPMCFVTDPPVVAVDDRAGLTITCELPAAISTCGEALPRRPGVCVDGVAVEALILQTGPSAAERIHIAPPSAFEYVLALEAGLDMGCVDCRECGHAHWDLGDFGRAPHRKHLCANCGRHTTWSKTAFVSTPLYPLQQRFRHGTVFEDAAQSIDIDNYAGCAVSVWSSLPAVLWTQARPQPRGIVVRIDNGDKRLVDGVFGTVVYQGQHLQRDQLWQAMLANTITSAATAS